VAARHLARGTEATLGAVAAAVAVWVPAVCAFRFRRPHLGAHDHPFTVDKAPRQMPLLLGFFLVSLFIWFAENISSFSAIWLYPHQIKAWSPVSLGKLGSWFLLMIISFVLVASVHKPRPLPSRERDA